MASAALRKRSAVERRFFGSRAGSQISIWLLRLAAIALVLGAWEFSARRGLVNPTFSGRPSRIGHELWLMFQHPYAFWVDLRTTVYETLVGFFVGSAAGLVTGFVFVRFGVLRKAFEPIMTSLNSMPRLALAPIFVVWFGIGANSKIALIISLIFFIVLLNTIAGLTQGQDRDFLLLSKSLGASDSQRLLKFALPASVPTLAAGLQLALVYSFLGAVGGELITGFHGVGVRLMRDANLFKPDEFFAVLFVLMCVTTAASGLMRSLERVLLRWHYIEMKMSSHGSAESSPR